MSLTALILTLSALVLYFAIRGHWAAYQARRLSILGTYWAVMTKPGAVVVDELSQVWPGAVILFDLPWCWNWRRYMNHPEHWDEVMTWAEAQMERSDLDLERFLREVDETVAATPAPTTATVPAAETDPERN